MRPGRRGPGAAARAGWSGRPPHPPGPRCARSSTRSGPTRPRPPLLVISHGAPGLIAAVELVFGASLRQRCLIHRARNVLAKVPATHQSEVKKAYWSIFDDTGAEPGEAAIAVVRDRAERFAATYARRFPAAVDCLMEPRWRRANPTDRQPHVRSRPRLAAADAVGPELPRSKGQQVRAHRRSFACSPPSSRGDDPGGGTTTTVLQERTTGVPQADRRTGPAAGSANGTRSRIGERDPQPDPFAGRRLGGVRLGPRPVSADMPAWAVPWPPMQHAGDRQESPRALGEREHSRCSLCTDGAVRDNPSQIEPTVTHHDARFALGQKGRDR